ncbi:hypothetical protein SAMD00023353_0602510 [Rosellinia necatrix]|uniref:Uncharacterized protein n=1 Tax=Rosellinia necatrix TaxID=77044 RepID=A0A1S7UL08_ROSNE|nr:hypothetical protein SAMD00023353_0602510 [Rosellinia necatrix]
MTPDELKAADTETRDLLEHLAEVVRLSCDRNYEHTEVDTLWACIIWRDSPPTIPHGPARIFHSPNITRSHLELMSRRNCGDYIQAEFLTFHDDEGLRRGRMLKALSKLSRKASPHTNRLSR